MAEALSRQERTDNETAHATAGPSETAKRPRWHLVYYILALFDVVAVVTGLMLNHGTMAIYEESVAVNESWSELQSRLLELGQLAADGNAPGNAVFENGDVSAERERLGGAEQAFYNHAATCRADIKSRGHLSREMLPNVEAAVVAFRAMATEANEIFTAIGLDDRELAGRHMSAMDHHYYQVSDAVSSLTTQISGLQKTAFAAQRDRARDLRSIEYVLAGMIFIMVAAVTLYGHCLARRMQRDADELRDVHARLIDSERMARQVIDTAGDGVVAFNEQGVVTAWNPRAESTFGWTRAEAEHRLLHELIVPESKRDSHPLSPNVEKVIGTTVEMVAARKDGELLTIELTLNPIRTDNGQWFSAILHDITERKLTEEKVDRIHRKLVEASRQAGMAEIATGVLHNVGNVLNSVNVSANLVADTVRQSRVAKLAQAADLISENLDHIDEFLTLDERGKHLPSYLVKLSTALCEEQKIESDEIETLTKNIEHIKSIVSTQQVYAKVCGVDEPVEISTVLDDALKISAGSIQRHNLEVVREDGDLPTVILDRQKLLQILVNLISNAKHAVCDHPTDYKRITIRTKHQADDTISIEVIDTGIGIEEENLTRIFSHGFTTKDEGHGFGLHSCALAANEMGGSLLAFSDGIGSGARFLIQLPITALEPTA